MTLQPGQEFAGYHIVRRLGAGGMGEVYLATHPRLPRSDALKILPQQFSADPMFRRRFTREADIAAGIDHPNVVSVYDRGESDGQLWITMSYVDGTDASNLLRDSPNGLATDEVSAIIGAVADALDHAHALGLLHRDVKPANILITNPAGSSRSPSKRRIMLADFGIARPMIDDSHLTSTNLTVGSVAYTSPEQLAGDDLDGRADQYSLACTAYQLLCGSTPFANSSPAMLIHQHLSVPPPPITTRRPDLSSQVDRVLARALDKEPARRYTSCEHFAADLEAALRARPADATMFAPASAPPVPTPPTQSPPPPIPPVGRPADPRPTPPPYASPPSAPSSAPRFVSSPAYGTVPAFTPAPLSRTDRKATAALIIGIVGIFIGFCTLGLLNILGIVLGIRSIKESDGGPTPYANRNNAVAGVVLGVVGLLISIGLLVIGFTTDSSS
ncbi:serine/threonine-protein kinase [Gordonia sp. ABSL1-1]|uniref:serine/threonine-protein kinase n=1 Tax=Gordonia sp. ABSL1-1 TaxID=3053923 RepID=UPI0025736CE6|nr:serine/threonine-protein kinase [Gordonia sp. ABSL1-1]MDL9937924.1 serine/threonine-protein kinase [Gordonia sp. ABSL1-1]